MVLSKLSAADYGVAGQPTKKKVLGLWTFEPSLVQESVELAIAHIGRYPELQQTLTAQVQAITTAAPTAQPDDLGAISAL